MGPEGSAFQFSELRQEWFVLEHTGYKEQGYFVDLGAGDGVIASNTLLLEKFYGWSGILCEPNPVFQQSLRNCRSNHVDDHCIWNSSGEIMDFRFYDNEEGFYGWNFRSGVSELVGTINSDVAKHLVDIPKSTLTLEDLLTLYRAPNEIDYLSVDIEGSEYHALRNFNFEEYSFKVITLEHVALTPERRQELNEVLGWHNYQLVRGLYTGDEDWYILAE